jgi:arginyl-tRNA synthetase
MDLKTSVAGKIQTIIKTLFGVDTEIILSVPEEQFGDFSTNVAMQLASKLGKPPRDIAEQIASELTESGVKVEVAGPGFINLSVSDEELWSMVGINMGTPLAGQKWVMEYACPNYFKELHAGHLYQTIYSDALARIIERAGANVVRTSFGADVGLSAARAVWGIIKDLGGEYPDKLAEIPTEKRTSYVAERYVEGARADSVTKDEQDQKQIADINKRIYDMHSSGDTTSDFAKIYYECRDWCQQYFHTLFAALRVQDFDKYYPESTTLQRGIATVREFQARGVFVESNGAVVFEGETYGLHTRVFITSAGLPTYEAKDIGLLLIEKEEYNFDKRLLVTGSDQIAYMKVVWKAMDVMFPGFESTMIHRTNGIVKFGDGKKMSSRLGNVTSAFDVISTVRDLIETTDDKERDERIALGALKYELLKYRFGGDIAFDAQSSVSMHGNSGPYLQYALVRAKSVLAKSALRTKPESIETSERSLVRKMGEYNSVVTLATEDLQVHHIANYLYELASEFNRFYDNNRMVGDLREAERLTITESYVNLLENGLALLGIQAPESM